MKNEKTIILTGAGATIPWGSPSTKDITDEIIKDDTYKTHTGQTVGEMIYNKLVDLYHKDSDTVNFETIISAVEYLITYFYSKNKESISKYKNLMPAFFNEKKHVKDLLSLAEKYLNQNTRFISCPNDYYRIFEEIYKNFVRGIIKMIEDYSIKIEEKEDLNKQLNAFLSSKGYPIRFYTTNYDRLIPKIYNGEMFEGFYSKDKCFFDMERVINDNASNVYYNMHGSAHYDIDDSGKYKYNKEDYVYSSDKFFNDSDQDKRKIINSNIIVGFNKPSRIITIPYSLYYHRFLQDCLSADKLYIIGYSFGDFHINSAINSALSINKKLKIDCITMYNKEFFDNETVSWIKLGNQQISNIIDKNLIDSIYDTTGINNNNSNIRLYIKGFKTFLKETQWNN